MPQRMLRSPREDYRDLSFQVQTEPTVANEQILASYQLKQQWL